MFTGLVQTTGELLSRQGSGSKVKLTVKADRPYTKPVAGESIAVNGVCLTLESWNDSGVMTFHTLQETLEVTNLGALNIGSKLNLERALRLGDAIGGHLVSGHIDAVGTVESFEQEQNGDWVLKIAYPAFLAPQMVQRGSIAIDGVSLTLTQVTERFLEVHIIPTTLNDTALPQRNAASKVNLETDIIGKYVERQLFCQRQTQQESQASRQGTVTEAMLKEAGFF